MINWIIGGIIAVFTLYIVMRSINRMRKGKSACSCENCSMSCGKRRN